MVIVGIALAMTSCRSSRSTGEIPFNTGVPTPSTSYSGSNDGYVATTPSVSYSAVGSQSSYQLANPADASLLRRYNVVVGAFSNLANAEAWKGVMRSRGYSGAYLLINEKGLYRVVAAGADTYQAAQQICSTIKTTYITDDVNTCPSAWVLTLNL